MYLVHRRSTRPRHPPNHPRVIMYNVRTIEFMVKLGLQSKGISEYMFNGDIIIISAEASLKHQEDMTTEGDLGGGAMPEITSRARGHRSQGRTCGRDPGV